MQTSRSRQQKTFRSITNRTCAFFFLFQMLLAWRNKLNTSSAWSLLFNCYPFIVSFLQFFSGSSQPWYWHLLKFSLLCSSIFDPEINQSPPSLRTYRFFNWGIRVCVEKKLPERGHIDTSKCRRIGGFFNRGPWYKFKVFFTFHSWVMINNGDKECGLISESLKKIWRIIMTSLRWRIINEQTMIGNKV